MENMGKDLLLAEYAAVQADIQRRLADRFYLTFGVLTVSVSLISVGGIPGVALLVFPWAIWLVSLWILHNEISVKRKNRYVRDLEHRHFPGGTGFLLWKDNLKKEDRLLSTEGLNIETVVNRILIGCDAGVLALGALRVWAERPSITEYVSAGVLFALALVAVVLTARNDFARRARKLAADAERRAAMRRRQAQPSFLLQEEQALHDSEEFCPRDCDCPQCCGDPDAEPPHRK